MNVFISYNRQNSAFVTSITRRLRGDISIIKELFFDQDNLQSGQVWTDEIQTALTNCDACVVFIGEQGIGGWQNKEVLSAVNRYVDSKGTFKLIPVIIPHSKSEPVQKNFPWFLADMQWIEFLNETDPDAFQKLTAFLTLGEVTVPIDPGIIPYKGLDFFDVADAPFFFGRTFDVNWIFYKKLTLEIKSSNRFLAIVGDSGSGKSSFARAGVLATIKAGKFAGSDTWKQLIFSPEDNPLLKLSASLQSAGIITDAAKMETDAKSDPTALRRVLEVYASKVVLMVDQFEEVLTQCKDNQLRESFLKNITEALKSQYFICIVTMRSDFYAAFSPFREFADMLEANNYTITSLDFNTGGEEWERYLRDIIQKPAKLLGVQFDATLTGQILEDCKSINGILPALQLALVELWKKRKDDKKIQSSDYDSLAQGRGIAGIIEEHANSIWKSITRDESDKKSADLIKAIFIRLVEITSNKEDVRKTVNKADLVNELSSQFNKSDIEETLDILCGINVRLIRIKRDTLSVNSSWVEVIHEALIRQWALLRKWLNERREAITYRNRLEQYIDDGNALYAGKKLIAAEQWVNSNKDLTTTKINSFIKQSRDRVNKKKMVIGVSAAAVLIIVIAAWLYKPVYECNNCALVKMIEAGNNNVSDIHVLAVEGTTYIEFIRCFKNLDTLVLESKPGENYLSQQSLDKLPKNLKRLTISGFGISDTLLNFQRFSQLRSLKILAMPGLQKISLDHLDSLSALMLSQLDNLKTLTGMEGLKSLKSLHLGSLPSLQKFTQLKDITNLTSLELSKVPISDLEEIGNLQGLENLTLNNLSIPNLSALGNFRNLKQLSLSVLAKVSTITGIESLQNLQTLNLAIHLDSITQLEKLKGLKTLTLDELRISDLSALKNLANLDTLTLKQLLIPTLEGIENLKKLRCFRLENIAIRNITLIKNLKALRSLYLSGLSGITSLAGIESPSLETLSLSNLESLSTLSGIETLQGLQYLTLSQLPVSDLKGIDQIGSLKNLVLSELINVPSINDIENCKKLESLSISFLNGIRNFEGIQQLQSLRAINIANVEASFNGVEKLENLKILSLSNMRVQDVAFLALIKNLDRLNLHNIVSSGNQHVPPLKSNIVTDTLSLSAMKMTDLDFIDNNLAIKVIEYDSDTELPDKESGFSNKAKQMKGTKFINLAMIKEMDQ